MQEDCLSVVFCGRTCIFVRYSRQFHCRSQLSSPSFRGQLLTLCFLLSLGHVHAPATFPVSLVLTCMGYGSLSIPTGGTRLFIIRRRSVTEGGRRGGGKASTNTCHVLLQIPGDSVHSHPHVLRLRMREEDEHTAYGYLSTYIFTINGVFGNLRQYPIQSSCLPGRQFVQIARRS